jgi:hypothetical protein
VISNGTGDTGTITARISRIIENSGNITAKHFRIIENFGKSTKGIIGPIAKFDGITNDIILQGQVTGIDPMPNISGMDIPPGSTTGAAGEELTDAKLP